MKTLTIDSPSVEIVNIFSYANSLQYLQLRGITEKIAIQLYERRRDICPAKMQKD